MPVARSQSRPYLRTVCSCQWVVYIVVLLRAWRMRITLLFGRLNVTGMKEYTMSLMTHLAAENILSLLIGREISTGASYWSVSEGNINILLTVDDVF